MDIGGQWATLVSIIIGLGIADLLVNLHRLIHARKEVKWDPLPLGWAAIALCWLFNYWWAVGAGLDGASHARVVGHYVLLAIPPILLFLMSASVLPRSLPSTGKLDMRAEWSKARTTFFALFAINQAITWCVVIAARAGIYWDLPGVTRTITLLLVSVALFVRSRRFEWLALLSILVVVIARLSTQSVR
jgi:hypothetical protein